MIFKSKKDNSFKVMMVFMVFLIAFMLIMPIYEGLEKSESIFSFIIGLLILWLFYGIYFNTGYELTKTELKYKSGPIKGAITIRKIHEIIIGKTLWSGVKPATARKGLIVKYGKYNKIYISPDTNDLFIKKILEINESIKITRK